MKGADQRRARQARKGKYGGQGRAPGWATRRLLLGLAFAAVTTLGWYLERDARTPAGPEQAPAAQADRSPSAPGNSSLSVSSASTFNDHAGRVVSVADGDTVRFRTASGDLRIRLDSIDAPEQDGGKDRPGQPFAQASKRHLEQWLQGRTVVARCFESDQYGRSVCDLIDAEGQSAARAQVDAGYAWAYTAARGRYLRDASLAELQARAKAAGLGLWQNGRAIAPWVWRYDCWREQQCAQ